MESNESDLTFHPFPRLPLELKRKIFRHALKQVILVSLEGDCNNDIAWLRLRPFFSFEWYHDDGKLADAFPEYLGDAKITRFAKNEDEVVITEDPNYRVVQIDATEDNKQRIGFPIEQFDTKRQTLLVGYNLFLDFHVHQLEIVLHKVNYLAVSVGLSNGDVTETDLACLCRFIQSAAPDLKELSIVLYESIFLVDYGDDTIVHLVEIDEVFRNEAPLYPHPAEWKFSGTRFTAHKFQELCNTASEFHDMYEKFCKDAADEDQKFWAKRKFSVAVYGEMLLEPEVQSCGCGPGSLKQDLACEASSPCFIGPATWIEVLDCSAPCDKMGILSSKYEGMEHLFKEQAELDLASGKKVEWCYDGIAALFEGEN